MINNFLVFNTEIITLDEMHDLIGDYWYLDYVYLDLSGLNTLTGHDISHVSIFI